MALVAENEGTDLPFALVSVSLSLSSTSCLLQLLLLLLQNSWLMALVLNCPNNKRTKNYGRRTKEKDVVGITRRKCDCMFLLFVRFDLMWMDSLFFIFGFNLFIHDKLITKVISLFVSLNLHIPFMLRYGKGIDFTLIVFYNVGRMEDRSIDSCLHYIIVKLYRFAIVCVRSRILCAITIHMDGLYEYTLIERGIGRDGNGEIEREHSIKNTRARHMSSR